LAELNDEQQLAAFSPEQHVKIIAGEPLLSVERLASAAATASFTFAALLQ
jgi:hypothetical protein